MKSHNIQPLLKKFYPKAKRAKGVYIYDNTGRAFLDGSSGAITCSLGHAHPVMIDRMKMHIDGLHYVYRSQFGSDQAEELAEKLAMISPGKHYQHTFFTNSGSDAIETAMKIALQYWQESGQPGKTLFITRRKSYHGITQGALSISGHMLRRAIFERSLDQYPILSADPEKSTLDTLVKEFETLLENHGVQNIAAFVAEPIVGAAGTALTPPPGYYEAFRQICTKNEILFIADEVMTGLGRTGSWFGLNHWNTVADIAAIGKSLGAGYAPIAATLVSPQILEPIFQGSGLIMSGHTYSAHPFSCAVASEVLQIIEEENLIEKVNISGKYLFGQLKKIEKQYECIEVVRGKGLLLGMELFPQYAFLQAQLIEQAFKNCLLLYPSVGGINGTDENGILIAPPFIISREEIDELIQKLILSLDQVITNNL